jgi:hypothetical protein
MYNTDTTLHMSEGELIETAGRIRAMIKRLWERGARADDLEWDLCYVQRELDLRGRRSETSRFAREIDAQQEAAAPVNL